MAIVPYKERKAAVEYCITHGKNYKLTAAYFGFTYQQIYGWVQRYHNENGGTAEIPADLLAHESTAGLQASAELGITNGSTEQQVPNKGLCSKETA